MLTLEPAHSPTALQTAARSAYPTPPVGGLQPALPQDLSPAVLALEPAHSLPALQTAVPSAYPAPPVHARPTAPRADHPARWLPPTPKGGPAAPHRSARALTRSG